MNIWVSMGHKPALATPAPPATNSLGLSLLSPLVTGLNAVQNGRQLAEFGLKAKK
jgi:hypothetical protein